MREFRSGWWSAGMILICLSTVRAENWPQWRGEHLDNISRETKAPLAWSQTTGVAWRTALPGPAGASPVVWNDRIFLTSSSTSSSALLLLCLGTDGSELWRREISDGNAAVRGDEGNFASPSPITDGRHVWCAMANGQLACFTVEGQPVWKKDLQQEYGKFKIQFGMTSTPILDNSRLYLQLIHGDGNPATQEALVLCLEGASGKELWKVARPSDGRDECEHSYASPTIYRDGSRAFLITHGADYAIGHDLADGRELWRVGNLNPKGSYENTLRFVASPVAVPGFIVVPTAKNRGVVCLKPEELSGDVTDKKSAYYWRRDRETPDVPSPLVFNGLAYLLRENGNLICLDARTGQEHYNKRTTADRHRASPICAAGLIYTCARNGKISVIKSGPELEIIKVNDLGEEITATPAFANGRLYIRTFQHLYAIGDK